MHIRLVLSFLFALALVRSVDAQTSDSDTLAAKLRLAEAASDRWLALVDAARYSESWDSAAADFKAQVSRSEWQAAVSAVRSEVNPLGARRLSNAHYTRELPQAPPGEYVVLQYSTPARNNARVSETMTLTLEREFAIRILSDAPMG